MIQCQQITDIFLNHKFGIEKQIEGGNHIKGPLVAAQPSGDLVFYHLLIGDDNRFACQIIRGNGVQPGKFAVLSHHDASGIVMRQADIVISGHICRLHHDSQIE